jgi:ferric-dicitrate binding protein FerR (iron transport regulator)
MDDNEQKSRDAIAEQAAEQFVANDDGPLDERDCAALLAWVKASPAHIEALLGVSAIAHDLPELRGDPEYSIEALAESARDEGETTVQSLRPRPVVLQEHDSTPPWRMAALAIGITATVCVGLFLMLTPKSTGPDLPFSDTTALHFETKHGEQHTWRLADSTVLALDTDSAVTIRYGKTERLVMLTAGQADFEVAHEPDRAFRVFAGAAEVIAIGTKFDVRLEGDATVVTMIEGRVAVGPSPMSGGHGVISGNEQLMRFIELGPHQQITLVPGEWPPKVITVDAQRDTAWMRRQIVFDHEPLKAVAAEFNRYTQKPISITTPALQDLQISGTFATDDIDTFVAFLRRLKGVQVEVTSTQIRVSGN